MTKFPVLQFLASKHYFAEAFRYLKVFLLKIEIYQIELCQITKFVIHFKLFYGTINYSEKWHIETDDNFVILLNNFFFEF